MRALLFYGHVASNWGDLAINAGAVEILKSCGVDVPGSTAVLLWPGEAHARTAATSLQGLDTRALPVTSMPRRGRDEIDLLIEYLVDPGRFFDDTGMADCDVVVLNAGEHLFESLGGENVIDLVWRILPAIVASISSIPVVLLPSTLGPFRSRFGVSVEKFLSRALSASAYRDSESKRLTAPGEERERRVLMDPGFFVYAARSAKSAPQEVRNCGIVVRLEDVGLRPGSQRSAYVQRKHRGNEYRDSQAFRLFAKVASSQIEAGATVTIIVQTQADRELSLALYEYLTAEYGYDHVQYKDPADFGDYMRELRALDLIVTSRFHAVILASAQGVPAVGVYSETHGHKMPGLFQYLEFPQGAVRLDAREVSVVHQEIVQAQLDAVREARAIQNRIRSNRIGTRRWLSAALDARNVPVADSTELRFAALAELYRAGLRTAEDGAFAEIKGQLLSLATRLEKISGPDAVGGDFHRS